jgi:eukaryotic-like serine/threonine-protein kinase
MGRDLTLDPTCSAPPPPIPEHELIRPFGSGSGGTVWLARNALGTFRAVKIVRAESSRRRRSFQSELDGVHKFEPVSRLHDGLVDILQVGGSDAAGYFYYVMELADDIKSGQMIDPERYVPRTLAHDLKQRGRLPIGECVRLGAAIASALGFLHRNGLLHRDIKPSNIIFVNGFPKLADIGLVSKISESGRQIGTLGFIPPEGAGTIRADVYSLGKVLYEISTGRDRNDYPELPDSLTDATEDRDLVRFNKIVIKASRAIAERRYESADELLTALLSFQYSPYDPRQEKARRRVLKLVSAGGLLLAAVVITLSIWHFIWLLKHGE